MMLTVCAMNIHSWDNLSSRQCACLCLFWLRLPENQDNQAPSAVKAEEHTLKDELGSLPVVSQMAYSPRA